MKYCIAMSLILCHSVMYAAAPSDAQSSLHLASYILNTELKYLEALQQFEKTAEICKRSSADLQEHDTLALALTGLAMCHHHIGQYKQRDDCMKEAQQLIGLPSNPLDYQPTIYKETIANFFSVDGYRFYIQYEQAAKNLAPIEEQRAYLLQAQSAFNKVLEIAQFHKQETIEMTHAYHGLGTIYEFLYKTEASDKDYLALSIDSFQKALHIRTQLLGAGHPLVARTHHKLARNYKLAAHKHYKIASHLYNSCGIPKEHPKYQELLDEII